MRRISFHLLLAATLLVLPAPSFSKANLLNSIRPLQLRSETGQLVSICTAWAVRGETYRLWVTAYHCVTGNEVADLLVDGKNASIERTSPASDLALLRGGPSADVFPVAFASPPPLTPVWTAGYPFGATRQHIATGVWSNSHDDDGLALYAVPVAHGMSGGPIVTTDGYVVGVMQQTECNWVGWCPVSKGPSTETLRAFLYPGQEP